MSKNDDLARREERTMISRLVRLAKRNKFEKLDNLLLQQQNRWIAIPTQPVSTDGKGKLDSTTTSNTGDSSRLPVTTLLHSIVKYHPPVSTVSLVIEHISAAFSDPNFELIDFVPEEATNGLGQTPLHIACAYHADIAVIKRLLRGTTMSMPACLKDCNDQLPLHHVFARPSPKAPTRLSLLRECFRPKDDDYVSLDNQQSTKAKTGSDKQFDNIALIVATLLNTYPESVMVRNKDGFTPLELARRNHYDSDKRIRSILETRTTDATESSSSVSSAAGNKQKHALGEVLVCRRPLDRSPSCSSVASSLSYMSDDEADKNVAVVSTEVLVAQLTPENLFRAL